MRFHPPLIILFSVCCASVACTVETPPVNTVPTPTSPSPAPTVFLQQSTKAGVPSVMQEIRGTLIKDDSGCLLLEDAERRWLIFWPSDVRLDEAGGTTAVVNAAGQKFAIGDRLTLGGSGSSPPKVTLVSGVTIPQNCRGNNVFIVDRNGVLA